MEHVGECPCDRRGQEGQTEQDQMHCECEYDVGEPDALAVQPRCVGVLFAVCDAYVHS